jgi:hypothetical protein
MNAFIKFNKSMMEMAMGWQLWLMVLVVHNMIVPLFYFGRLEAQVVFVTLLASMGLMTLITAKTGFTRLLGFGHILWVPLLYWLWTRLPQIPTGDIFGVWVRSLMVVNAISLVIDAVDVARYIAGDRAATVVGRRPEPHGC